MTKQRREKVEEIMNSHNDTNMFYKYVRKQLKSANIQLNTLIVEEKTCGSQEKFDKIGLITFNI